MRIRREQAHRIIKGRDTTSGRDTSKPVKSAKRVLGQDSGGKAIHQGDQVEILLKSRLPTALLYKVKEAVAIGLDNQGW
eukprot:11863174-Ditylum_brightwellii.AAC.1